MPSQDTHSPSAQITPEPRNADEFCWPTSPGPGKTTTTEAGRTSTVGNTEVLAGMISDRLDCDLHRIEAADPYPDSYDATVARNVREQNGNARPAIV